MNNSIFGKTMKNVRQQKDIKIGTLGKKKERRRHLVSEPNYHATK